MQESLLVPFSASPLHMTASAMDPIECKLSRVVMSEGHDQHVVVLEEADGERRFPILIGGPEVFAIHRAVNSRPPPRPLTHELIASMLDTLNVQIERIVINDLKDGTFFGRVHLRQGDHAYDIDARPSDAIALAMMAGAPIFVAAAVLDEASSGI
jgi:uncharacterized protein